MPNTTEYRWYEASYWRFGSTPSPAPFSLSRSPEDADLAAAPIMHLYQFAFGPVAIDDENEGDFIERWATVLAVAAQGKLGFPRNLPLHETFWRNSFVA